MLGCASQACVGVVDVARHGSCMLRANLGATHGTRTYRIVTSCGARARARHHGGGDGERTRGSGRPAQELSMASSATSGGGANSCGSSQHGDRRGTWPTFAGARTFTLQVHSVQATGRAGPAITHPNTVESVECLNYEKSCMARGGAGAAVPVPRLSALRALAAPAAKCHFYTILYTNIYYYRSINFGLGRHPHLTAGGVTVVGSLVS